MKKCPSLLSASIASAILGSSAAPAVADQVTQLPISAFLNTQGSKTVFIPPVPDYLGWTAPPPGVKTPATSYVGGNAASCDYAGIANKWLVQNYGTNLGTSITGSVTERELPDGRIQVNVELRAVNALTFGTRITQYPYGDFATDPLIFGARAQDVLAGATPGLGECLASFAWKQNPGPLVDFAQAVNGPVPGSGFELVNISFRTNAKGPLKALAGYGPDGTPGRLIISETGFSHTTFKGATADAFPAEFVEVRAVGR